MRTDSTARLWDVDHAYETPERGDSTCVGDGLRQDHSIDDVATSYGETSRFDWDGPQVRDTGI